MNEDLTPLNSTSIKFLSGPLAGQTFPISKSSVTIGRASTNDIVVKDDLKVSRTHARLLKQNGSWSIEKLAPYYNTLTVNQQHVQQAMITNNATIRIGADTSFLFLIKPEILAAPRSLINALPDSPSPDRSAQSQQRNAGSLIQSGKGPNETQIAQDMPTLEVSNNINDSRQSYPLIKDVTNIGRESSNDICIKDGSIVSGHQLQIIRQGDQFMLIHPHPDQPKTLNGLLYQGHMIRGDEPFRKPLTNGDLFRIGDENGTLITLIYNDGTGIQAEGQLPPVQPIRLDTREITIGRKPDNTLVLTHPQVSAHHALL